MKRKDELVLGVAWVALYLPYVVEGGWVRDDLALLTSTRWAQSYLQWQWFISGNRDMTARPVSAILHGLSYWLLGSDAWHFHLLNLVLFGAAIILFYEAVRKLISRDVALVASLLALVYPCASTVVFSSIMMNSNLAAFFWSAGLYVSAGHFKQKLLLTTALYAMSALSYEAFIPLLAFGILVDIFLLRLHRSDRRRLLIDALPALTATAVYAGYRAIIEKLIFHTTFSRLVIAGPAALVEKFLSAMGSGLRIIIVDGVALSLRGFSNLGRVPAGYLALAGVVVVLAVLLLYRSARPVEGDADDSSLLGSKPSYLALVGFAACLLAAAHLIFVLSNYTPSSLAFNNRTLEGIQFAAASSIALLVVPIGRGLLGQRVGQAAPLFVVVVFLLFTVGTIGQRQAWILAGRYNEQMANEITDAIRSQPVDPAQTLTMVAYLPTEFPGQIDAEPTLGVFWEITPLLILHNPGLVITADVYNPTAAATPAVVTIVNYDHLWEGAYPLWLYSYADHKMYRVESQQDWSTDLELAMAAARKTRDP